MKRFQVQVLCTLVGILVGYLILHPYAMLVYFLTGTDQSTIFCPPGNELSVRTLAAFNPIMLPMSISFAAFGGIIGFMIAVLLDKKKRLDVAAHESEKNSIALEAIKELMVTLSHYLLNANMIIGGKVRHCRKATSDQDILAALSVAEEQGRKIDAVVGALRKIVEIKKANYTTDGRVSMLDISKEIEEMLHQSEGIEGKVS